MKYLYIKCDNLLDNYRRASGGELHNGSEREENPVDKEEIETMCAKMREITRK